MLTQNITQELEAVLQSLHNQGKEPTVALVKARLKTPVPMPALIATIRSWKHAQRVPKVEIAADSTPPQDKIAHLEQQIKDLKRRLETLEAKLAEKL